MNVLYIIYLKKANIFLLLFLKNLVDVNLKLYFLGCEGNNLKLS